MQLSSIFLVLLTSPAILLASSHHGKYPCLTTPEAHDIATRYLHLYDQGAVKNISQVAAVLSPGMTSYDEVGPFNTGPYSNRPSTTGVQAFFESVTGTGPSAYRNSTQRPLFLLNSCDEIAYRWQFTAFSTGYDSYVLSSKHSSFLLSNRDSSSPQCERHQTVDLSTQFRTVPPGTPLEFKGNDILHVDLKTRLIDNATSSGDWLNLARELGQIVNVTCAKDPTMVSCIV